MTDATPSTPRARRTWRRLALGALFLLPSIAWALPERLVYEAGTPIRASELNQNFEALWSAVDALETAVSALQDAPPAPPPGTIVAFAGRAAAVPEGWLPCDGRGLARDEHPALWDAIETAWGDGSASCDGSCDFNVPDLRGVFLRGVDLGAARDPDAADRTRLQDGGNQGDAVGSYQADALAAHHHLTFEGAASNIAEGGNFDFINRSRPRMEETSTTGGNETRPKNVAVTYMIKL